MTKRLNPIPVLVAVALLLLGSASAQQLRAGVAAQPETLDPHSTVATSSFQTSRSLYDTLVDANRAGEIVPSLASSWTISDDGLVWTFTLTEGVRFHNGETLTAADVVASFNRLRDSEGISQHHREYAVVSGLEALDDHTVVFELSEPTPGLLASLASGWSVVMPASLIDAGHDFANDPVGTGPFTFVEWVRDSYLELARFDDYFGGPALVDSVHLTFITDSAIQLQGLMSGEFHIIDTAASADLPIIESHPELATSVAPSGLVLVAALNGRHPPLDNPVVRRALNHAVDSATIMEVAYGGGFLVGTFMEYGSPWLPADIEPYEYDPERARQLLAEAGHADGLELRILLPQIYPAHILAGEIIQAQLAEVGVNSTIEVVEWGVWLSDVYSGNYDYDITVIGHTGKLDPTGRLGGYHTDRNYVNFSHPRLTEVLDAAAVSIDWDARAEYYAEAFRILHDEAPWIYLGTPHSRITHRAEIDGFWMTPLLDTWNFDEVFFVN